MKVTHGVPHGDDERVVLANGVDRPCDGEHPPPTTLQAVYCSKCGAFKLRDTPLVYVEKGTQ